MDNKTTIHKISTWLALSGLVILSINPGLTQGEDNKNLLLCVVMCLSPAVLLLREARVIIPRIDLPLGAVCVLVIAFPTIFHPESMRWITMLFTCACCVYFMMLARLVRIASLTPRTFCRTIKGLIYAYTAVLLVQQLCVATGLPTFMSAMVYPEHPWKLNSLTAEPSHTSVTLCMAMFAYTQTCHAVRPNEGLWSNIRSNPTMWICWAWVIFTTDNASAFILAPLAITPYLTWRNIYAWGIGFLITCAAIYFTPLKQYHQFERIILTTKACTTLDEQIIIDADESAAARIVPTFRGVKALTDSSCMEIITGHGTDADQRDLPPRPCDRKERGFAGIFCMCYNYGLLCATAFWIAIAGVTLTRRRWTTALTFMFAIQLSADFNMQLVWMTMAYAMIFKYNVCNRRELLSTLRNVTNKSQLITGTHCPPDMDNGHNRQKKRVAIIGSQGVPPQYGGFETLVDNIIRQRDISRVEYTIFCSKPDTRNDISVYKGCELRYVNLHAHGVSSIPYDIVSMIRASRGFDTLLLLGVSGCIFLPLLRHMTRAKIIVNIDGFEHERDKWNSVAKRFLKLSLDICIRFADEIVSDNKGIKDEVLDKYGREACLIAYGGDHALREYDAARQQMVLDVYGLTSGNYDLSICRIEPENNCEITLETYATNGMPMVIVGNWHHSDYSRKLFYRYKRHKNLRLLPPIYDLDTLYVLRNNMRYYIHGHKAGGTNPSLVEAMFFGKPIIAYDVKYNRATTQDAAYYYSDDNSLASLVARRDLDGRETTVIARSEYIWQRIAREYEALY